ncbi:hypothetical protein SYNTR_1822 [Candidatus Syntrophocurvum alkaliphilum]|uniref:Uncharacterized protein n=1 Tax=Candidatus Syntrophocurvum alkaliphilum TaxID=2293317 RepID=A0A6I6DE88_9FIRM|nr:hypothetical protein [Candidatus Syntrophocurvum alkaliphilum]QGU00416.1 hypothetical protein SYNTR_1822 [Candidatus Syntrophocurvum alkaliphilum]
MYLKLILEENDLDALIEFVRDDPSRIEEFAYLLNDRFSEEVVDLYKIHIRTKANNSSKRTDYRGVCEILKRYRKIAGKDKQKDMVNELKINYKNKPAFIDELSKII